MFEQLAPYTHMLILGLAGVALLLAIWTLVLHSRLNRLLRGKSGADLEAIITALHKDGELAKQFQAQVRAALAQLDTRLLNAMRGSAVVRFDAFSGSGDGGKQSFALALLSEDGSGIVLSSLHARESTRIFAKSITNFASDVELTEEEVRAIKEARATLQ